MGYYINSTPNGTLPPLGKVNAILKLVPEAKLIPTPSGWIPNLVCVVNNGVFDAAVWCFNESEFQAFNDPDDGRIKRWMVVPNADLLAK